MKLSIRLQTVADNIGEFKKLVDIGSDHGQLPIYLKEKFPEQVICASEAQTMTFENLKKENNISEKYLAKQGKASLQLEKYADKEGYIIGESTKYKGQVLCIMKKVKEESILKNKIFEQRNGKIKCIFEFI